MRTLSVIIPNYNNEKYIEQCINSILNQSYPCYEIIVVDDRSTDSSRKIISELARKYDKIKPIFLEINQGVSNARNTGLEAARGEYITFIDSDDFYYSNSKLENEMNLIDKYEKEGKQILSYSVTMNVDETGILIDSSANHKWYKHQFINGNSKIKMISMAKQSRVPRDYCIKKDVIEHVGAYSYPHDFYEDLDLLMRLATHGVEFYCTFSQGTAYRQTHRGLSSRKQEEHLVSRKSIANKYYNMLTLSEKFECISMRINHKTWMNIKNKILLPVRNIIFGKSRR